MPVHYTERFSRQYERLPKVVQKKADKALRLLAADFRHPGLQSHPVQGWQDVFEARVDLKYRMTFERRSDLLVMRNVDNHDECLNNP